MGIHTLTKECDWRNDLKRKHKEHYLNFVPLPPHRTPPYPLTWVPLLPALHPLALPILIASVPAAHSEKKRKQKSSKSQSVM